MSKACVYLLFNILGFNNENEESKNNNSSDELISLLIKIRNEARLNKNFKLSDQIRDDLLKLGVQLNDEQNSSSYKLVWLKK